MMIWSKCSSPRRATATSAALERSTATPKLANTCVSVSVARSSFDTSSAFNIIEADPPARSCALWPARSCAAGRLGCGGRRLRAGLGGHRVVVVVYLGQHGRDFAQFLGGLLQLFDLLAQLCVLRLLAAQDLMDVLHTTPWHECRVGQK